MADYRNHPHPVALRVRFAPPHGVNHASLQVAVRLDPDSDFEPCFSIPKLPLRSGKYFLGFSAANQVNDGQALATDAHQLPCYCTDVTWLPRRFPRHIPPRRSCI